MMLVKLCHTGGSPSVFCTWKISFVGAHHVSRKPPFVAVTPPLVTTVVNVFARPAATLPLAGVGAIDSRFASSFSSDEDFIAQGIYRMLTRHSLNYDFWFYPGFYMNLSALLAAAITALKLAPPANRPSLPAAMAGSSGRRAWNRDITNPTAAPITMLTMNMKVSSMRSCSARRGTTARKTAAA